VASLPGSPTRCSRSSPPSSMRCGSGSASSGVRSSTSRSPPVSAPCSAAHGERSRARRCACSWSVAGFAGSVSSLCSSRWRGRSRASS
jgi:hypothetical protein